MAGELPFEMPLVEMRKKIAELKQFGEEKGIDFTDEVARLEERYRVLEEEIYSNISPSQKCIWLDIKDVRLPLILWGRSSQILLSSTVIGCLGMILLL